MTAMLTVGTIALVGCSGSASPSSSPTDPSTSAPTGATTPQSTLPSDSTNVPASTPPTTTTDTTATTTTTTEPPGPRRTIGIRQVGGVGEFYVVDTGERFVPRGTNLVDNTIVDDSVNGRVPVYGALSTEVYESDQVRAQLADMAALGFNVVRVMFEVCGTSGCITNDGEWLNEAYLDNAADFLEIAAEEGVYVWYSSNTLPDRGEYSRIGLQEGEADFLTPLNIETYGDYFTDIITALRDRGAPLDNLFSFEIRNEFQYLKTYAPWDRTERSFTAANGDTYDLADDADRRRLAEDGLIFWADAMTERIKSVAPDTLVSIGLLIPNEPIVISGPDDPRFIYPGAIYDESIIDFFDIHTGPGWPDIHVVETQFGRSGQQDKPVVMGEFPISRDRYPHEDLAAREMVAWQVGSCDAGWDGWLSWHWTGDETFWPIAGTRIGEVLAPVNHPDPCEPVEVDVEFDLLNWRGEATASFDGYDAETDESYPAGAATDQNQDTWWSADNGPPQWLEVHLEEPSTVGRVRLPIGFVTPAGHVRIEVSTVDADGTRQDVHVFDDEVSEGVVLEWIPETPLDGIVDVRFDITDMQGWVIIHEVEILSR